MANNPTLGIRIDPDLKAWISGMEEAVGYKGGILIEALAAAAREASGDDFPQWFVGTGFKFDLSIVLRSGKRVSVSWPPAHKVAEAKAKYGKTINPTGRVTVPRAGSAPSTTQGDQTPSEPRRKPA